MPNDRISQAQASYTNEIRQVQQSAEKWQDFLNFAAQLHISESQSEYEFSTKLTIHAINPNAKDCREFDEWKTGDGNHVNKFSKGIAVLTRNNDGNQTVRYLFDTSQTALNLEPKQPDIAETGLDSISVSSVLHKLIEQVSESAAFSEQQEKIFRETAEYMLCKKYGLETSENPERFSGIESLSVRDIAGIGVELNKCSRMFTAEIERSIENERERGNNSKSGNDRSELYGRERNGMGVGRDGAAARNEVPIRRGNEPVVQSERGELDIRAADRNSEAEADSGNGQIWQSETEIHLADPEPDRSNNAEWRHSEALRENERGSSEPDREADGEEKAVGGIQGDSQIGQVHSNGAAVGEIQDRSGRGNTPDDSLRNIKEQTADSEKVSAVSVLDTAQRSKNGDLIVGNTTYRYIPEKTYVKADKAIAESVAERLLEDGNIKFSSVFKEKSDTVTFTVSQKDKSELEQLIDSFKPQEQEAVQEPDIIGTYAIYQLKGNSDLRDYRFASSEEVKERGLEITADNYALVYSGELTNEDTPDSIFTKFNIDRPADFTGHSLSVSDIIVLDTDSGRTANYVDRVGFTEVPEFFAERAKENTVSDNIETEQPQEKKAGKDVDELKVGDFIRTGGETWKITNIDGDFSLSLENADKSSAAPIRGIYGHWKENLKAEGYEYVPAKDIIEMLSNAETAEKEKSKVSGELPETRFTSLTEEQKNFYDLHSYVYEPDSSPWGEIQTLYKINNGIYDVSTASHGGIMVKSDIGDKIFSKEAKEHAFKEKGFMCFEEDVASAFAFRELIDKGLFGDIDLFFREQYGSSYEEKIDDFNSAVNGIIQRYYPDYFEKREQAIFKALSPEKQAEETGQMMFGMEEVAENGAAVEAVSEIKPDSIEFSFGFTESDLLDDFKIDHKNISFALGNALIEYLDEKQHTERDIPELNVGWYDKTDFMLKCVINGEEFGYEGRFDIGDGNGTGGGSLIDHIRQYNENAVNINPFHLSEEELADKRKIIDTVIPFLEKHSALTPEEQRIFEDFKAENPIITSDMILTDKERAFLNGDIVPFMAKAVLAWDEIESIGYRLYEDGYNEKFAPNDNASYGNGLSETALHSLARRMRDGEDIRKELAKALLGNQSNFITSQGNEFTVEYGDDFAVARYGNAERQISYEDLGSAFFKLFRDEYDDIVHGRTVEDLRGILPDISVETADKLINAFDGAAMHGWNDEKLTNNAKINKIKKALYDILGDEEKTERAFASIAYMKYNYKGEQQEQEERSLSNSAVITEEMYDIKNAKVLSFPKGDLAEIEILANEELLKRFADNGLSPKEITDKPIILDTDGKNWNKFIIPDKFGNKWNRIDAADILTSEEMAVMKSVVDKVIPDRSEIKINEEVDTDIQSVTVTQPEAEVSKIHEAFEKFKGNHSDLTLYAQKFLDRAEKVMEANGFENFYEAITTNLMRANYGSSERINEVIFDNRLDEFSKEIDGYLRASEQELLQNPAEIVSEEKQVLYSIEINGEISYYKTKEFSSDEIVEAAKDNYSYLALVSMGDRISSEKYAEMEQSDTFSSSVEINLDSRTAKIYKVNDGKGGISEADRTDDNVSFENLSLVQSAINQPEMTEQPYIICEWSENNAFEDGKQYSVSEFDELMKQANAEYAAGKKAQIEKYGSQNAWNKAIENSRQGDEDYYEVAKFVGYDKVKFTLAMPDGSTYTERQDVGDNEGGVIDFLRQYPKYDDIVPILENIVESEIQVSAGQEEVEKKENAAIQESPTEEPAAQPEQAESAVPEKDNRFKITDEHIGEGGAKTKFRNNIEAIKTLKQLEQEERLPTPEEQETLSKYVGWGGIQEAFDVRIPSWNAEYYELKNLLTEDEYEAALSTVNDAFYTSPVISEAIYEALGNMGFDGGEILEPSMGIGNFFGTMPDKMRDNSNLSGIEIDSISGRIAKMLYPEADIAINGYENIKINKNSFDLAVGNVPFGNFSPDDKTKAYKGLLIHDYFFAKSIDSVRSGGIVAFVTSKGTLDKEDTKVRKMLAQKAELLGAIRLPDSAFKKNAGTETTTDIIFLKKREKPLELSEMAADASCDWVHTKENADGFKINSYFADNPQMILGTLDKDFRGGTVCKALPDSDLKEQLHEAVKNIKGEYTPLEFQTELDERDTEGYLPATPDVENLTYTVVDDKLYFRVDDNLIPLKENEQHGKTAERRKAMCGLAETTRQLLQAQVEDLPDTEIQKLQKKLNSEYDRFAKKYGRINAIEKQTANGISKSSPNSNAFKNDVRLPLLQSLEIMEEGQYVGKAEIFTERTIRPHKAVEHVETSHEALILSVSEKGRIDFDYMQELTGFEKDKIISDLKGDIYPVPELSSADETVYQTSDEYLSGNIYKKIAIAESLIAENPEYASNIAALREVIPTPLKATEIDIQLGATWLDPKIIQQFMYETFETPDRFREYAEDLPQDNPRAITVSYSGAGKGSWHIENAKLDNSVKATKAFGTNDYNAYELLERILNYKPVTVTETYKDEDGKSRTVILEKPTKAAEDKVKQIQAAFSKWIFSDPERRTELVKTYNERFNCIRPREYDGSSLQFFGSNPEITLKPHQKNAVAHALFGENTLFAHEVGAGKTFEMIAAAMEGKRLGLHNKSMFVVPNHLTEQIGADFMKLYPNANILVAKQDDFSPQKRRRMCARIATGNFDAVIIGHSQLIKIPLSPEREKAFIKEQIAEITESIAATKEAEGASYTIKDMEKTKARLRERLEKLTNSTVKDSTVTFEELGIDKLFVDEAHEFKNLYVATKMENVSGLATNDDVQKTQDLFMKCQYLDEKTDHKGIVFSTGTPVTNALSEMFTMQKYLQSRLLKEMGLDSFDAWAGNFTRKSTEAEISPSGTDWRMKTRLKFTNVPELVTAFKECADIKLAEQLNLDVPECEKTIVSVEPTETQKAIVESLGERAERISKGLVSRSEDNMLCVTGDGRKTGLDQRLYDPQLPDEPQTKINTCINNVFDIWEKTAENRSTQLVFCDLGVPQSKEDIKKNGERFSVYEEIKQKLIEKGIPEKEIAFIHEAKSETDKAKLFAKVRSGEVRVLIGSTQKMGAGTNVQKKLIALHDLDCPWRPADLTQRLGRMVRQGNENKKVYNFRYVTKGTFDSYLYQMVEKKQAAISQIFTARNINRTCDDIDDTTLDCRQAKIAAIGDERIKRQMELRDEISNLKMLRNVYLDSHYELEDRISRLPAEIKKSEKIIEGIAADTKTVQDFVPKKDIDGNDVFEMKIGNTVYTDKKEAAEAFGKAMKAAATVSTNKSVEIAEYKGFKIAAAYDTFRKSYTGEIKGSNTYFFDFGMSDSGNLTRIDNTISSIPLRMDGACNRLEQLKTELTDSKAQLAVPFEYEAELSEKEQELERLTEEINADKLKGDIKPEQPESTAESDTAVPEVPAQAETAAQDKTAESPQGLNIRWTQNGKELKICYDGKADSQVKAYADGKEIGHCSPEQLAISNADGNYPKHITKCIKPLNLAFSEETAVHIGKFIEKVSGTPADKPLHSAPLFSKAKVMSDEFKPTSSKGQDKPQEKAHGK